MGVGVCHQRPIWDGSRATPWDRGGLKVTSSPKRGIGPIGNNYFFFFFFSLKKINFFKYLKILY
jgi:hypothetical protein